MLKEDPLLQSSRREMWVVLALFAIATTTSLTISYRLGYNRDPATLTYWFGFPDWVFWGVVVPWIVSSMISLLFATFFMRDGDLGEDLPEEGSEIHD